MRWPLVVGLLSAPVAGWAGAAPSCDALAGLTLPDTTITTADINPGDGTCRVAGTVAPAIRFQVWMPMDGWNGKLLGVGNGGLGGYVNTLGMAIGIERGFATAATDGGHAGTPFDASWALGRPDLLEDFGHRATHVMTVAAKAIVAAFYGTPPARSYFMGCSTGGRQGLIEAERYPADYDGVVAGAPANPLTAMPVIGNWVSQAVRDDPETAIPASKLPAIASAVLARCDGRDGVVDGVVGTPDRCRFRPGSIRCRRGTPDDDTCLTIAQVKGLKKLYAGPRRAKPRWSFPGFVPGGEIVTGNDPGPAGEPNVGAWEAWIVGAPGLHHAIQESFFQFVVFEDPNWDWRTFDFRRDAALARRKLGDVLDAHGDLEAFQSRGGKVVMYHGWSDPAIPPLVSVAYRRRVVRALGRRDTDAFLRLFMAPGMQHCAGGAGPNVFDPLTALERWVETDTPPDVIIATHRSDGVVDRTRPLCPYPQVAVWDRHGDSDHAASFSCGRRRRR
jgi:feruloyl esterase